jgi:preprotein translocase subunit YajC
MKSLQPFIPYILFWIAVLVVFFWLVVRPKRRDLSQHKALIEGLKRGDRIVTAGGIHGEIVGLQEKTITVRIAPQVEITLERRAVRRLAG